MTIWPANVIQNWVSCEMVSEPIEVLKTLISPPKKVTVAEYLRATSRWNLPIQ